MLQALPCVIAYSQTTMIDQILAGIIQKKEMDRFRLIGKMTYGWFDFVGVRLFDLLAARSIEARRREID